MVSKFNGFLQGPIIDRGDYSDFFIETDEPHVYRSPNGFVHARGITGNIPLQTPIEAEGKFEDEIFYVEKISILTNTIDLSIKYVKNIIKRIKSRNQDFKIANNFPRLLSTEFGPNIVSYIKESKDESEIISRFPKIDEHKLKLVYSEMKETISGYEILSFLSEFAISQWKAYALARKYGTSAIGLLKRNPYKYGYEVGISFHEADRIAFSLGFDYLNKKRMKNLLNTAFDIVSSRDGSTVVLFTDMVRQAQNEHKRSIYYKNDYVDIPKTVIQTMIHQNKSFITSNNRVIYVQSKEYALLERKISFEVMRLCQTKAEVFDLSKIDEIERKLHIKYSDGQRQMLLLASSTGLKIVTGGPGAGKTTGLNGLITLYKEMYPYKKIKLCAPTGRAAQRMTELTGMKASTIHRLINISPVKGSSPAFNKTNSLMTDLLIVDEFSMVDEHLFLLLLEAIKKDTLVVLVGDEDQLPSVGPGAVLRDLIESNLIPLVRLNGSYRSSSSVLITNAHKILAQDIDFDYDESFKMKTYSSNNEMAGAVMNMFIKEYDQNNPFDMQILTTSNLGSCGTVELNKRILSHLFGGTEKFYVGERILFIRNNVRPSNGYVNGDLGIITAIDEKTLFANVNGQTIMVSGKDLLDIVPSYVMTIHKSQGSEFSRVITVLPSAPKKLLNRNLFYTALTRTKTNAEVYTVMTETDGKALSTAEIAISSRNTKRRKTGLRNEIEERFKQKKA